MTPIFIALPLMWWDEDCEEFDENQCNRRIIAIHSIKQISEKRSGILDIFIHELHLPDNQLVEQQYKTNVPYDEIIRMLGGLVITSNLRTPQPERIITV